MERCVLPCRSIKPGLLLASLTALFACGPASQLGDGGVVDAEIENAEIANKGESTPVATKPGAALALLSMQRFAVAEGATLELPVELFSTSTGQLSLNLYALAPDSGLVPVELDAFVEAGERAQFWFRPGTLPVGRHPLGLAAHLRAAGQAAQSQHWQIEVVVGDVVPQAALQSGVSPAGKRVLTARETVYPTPP